MKQALITIEHPLRLGWTDNADVDPIAWHVGMIVGQLDGWKDVAAETADTARCDGARLVRTVAASAIEEGATIYVFVAGGAEHFADVISGWPAADYWVGPPRPAIPENMPEHDVIALKKSLPPLPDSVAGDVFRRVDGSSFSDEEWWPGRCFGDAFFFPASLGEYQEHLEDALRKGNYDAARGLVLFSPRGGDHAHSGPFEKSTRMLDFVTLYVTPGASVECTIGVNFYSRRLDLAQFLTSAMDALSSSEYECYRSAGVETFKQWTAEGRLPEGLHRLA